MKKYLYLLFAISLAIGTTNGAKAQINTQDSLALVDLFNSTNGVNWTTKTNWLSSSPVSSWFGVTIDSASNRVTELNLTTTPWISAIPWIASTGYLRGVKLKGSIPASIGNLTELKVLVLTNVDYNIYYPGGIIMASSVYDPNSGLTGSIPSTIGNLTKLTYLDLSFNHLNDSIPPSFYQLTKLDYIDLQRNDLSGHLSSSLGNLNKLKTLFINHNHLTGSIPFSIGNLVEMSNLDFSYNQLNGPIPTSITNLKKACKGLNGSYSRDKYIVSYNFNFSHNKFTFSGMEMLAHFIDTAKIGWTYILEYEYNYLIAPQDTIIPIQKKGNQLYVSVGGTLANNTFKWYRNANLQATITGDSTFTPTTNGVYNVVASNAIAATCCVPYPVGYGLNLYSDTLVISNLPISLSSIVASSINNTIHVNWQTASELNTYKFNIQHSYDGKSFTDIGTVYAKGAGANSYEFIDKTPSSGSNFYRIKSIDKDGSASFTKSVFINLNENTFFSINPNPANDVVVIKFNKPIDKATIIVYDNSGKIVNNQSVSGTSNAYTINTQSLSKGTYLVKVKTATESYMSKLLIIK